MENTKHPFSADRPITSCSEDLLGRSGFAKSIAAAIKGWIGNDSLVIALYGSWGSGKTSIKNMAIETLPIFTREGASWSKLNRVFSGELETIIHEINEAIAA